MSTLAPPIETAPPAEPAPKLRPWVVALAAAGYFACAAAATYPVITSATSAIPGHLSDPLEHLWIMRWTERCLQEGRSPWFCPEVQYPVGVPLGLFPTMHLQTAGYLALGWLTQSDVVRFNVLWAFGFVSTGVTSFVLAWAVTRRLGAAWLGGLGVMLCGPMLMHAHGHLETMQMGAVPLFLLAWLRFIDRPTGRNLMLAAGMYLLVVASAPYFAVLAVFPAGWYVVWSLAQGVGFVWVRERWLWLVGFAAAVVPGLALLFAGQIWAAVHGYAMARPRAQFDWFGAPVWSYFAPTPRHALGGYLAPDLYRSQGYAGRMFECESYLGVVALGLLAYTFGRRVRFARSGFWWTTLALLVVLSWGAKGPFGVKLPAGWLHDLFPPFQLIRVPARFNLFAAAVAVVPVAAELGDLLDRLRDPRARAVAVALATGLTVADLAVAPFPTSAIPPMPPIYRELVARKPGVAVLDAPVFDSSQGHVLGSLCGYWQSIHRGRTSAGYSGIANQAYDAEISHASPWSVRAMSDDAAALPPRFGPIRGADPRDLAWLFLAGHGYDHLVLHQGAMLPGNYAAAVARWKALLGEARSYEDADVAVFDRDKVRPPAVPVAMIGAGWRTIPMSRKNRPAGHAVATRAGLFVFNPDPAAAIVVRLVTAGPPAPASPAGTVRLLDDRGRVLASWPRSATGAGKELAAEVRIPGGIQKLTLAVDGGPALSKKNPGLIVESVEVGPWSRPAAAGWSQANPPDRR